MNRDAAHLSAFVLDALALGEGALTTDARTKAHRHVQECATCRAELAAVEAARAKFHADVFPRTVSHVGERARRRRRFARIGFLTALPTIAAAAALVLSLRSVPDAPLVDDDYLAVKGSASLRIVAKRGERQIEVHDGVALAPTDAIRFVVESAGHPYLLVVSVDGAGRASVYFPAGSHESARISSDAKVELPGSIVLDRAPGPERIFALFSDAPIATSQVVPALEAIGARGREAIVKTRDLPVGASAQRSIVIEKSVP